MRITSSGYARNLRKECAGRVAGLAVLTGEIKDGDFHSASEVNNMPLTKSRHSVSHPTLPLALTETLGGLTPLLTPDQVAMLLGVPRLTVIRQSKAGKIPALKIGKAYRYRVTAIASWLAQQERGGVA